MSGAFYNKLNCNYEQINLWVNFNTLGLYSALRACNAIDLSSNLQSKLTVDTIFLVIDQSTLLINVKFEDV